MNNLFSIFRSRTRPGVKSSAQSLDRKSDVLPKRQPLAMLYSPRDVTQFLSSSRTHTAGASDCCARLPLGSFCALSAERHRRTRLQSRRRQKIKVDDSLTQRDHIFSTTI